MCAEEVRETSCVNCLHYEKCAAKGRPVSILGNYLAWLNLEVLKPICDELSLCCNDSLYAVARVPDDREKDAYVVIRVYSGPDRKHLLLRLKLQGIEDEEELKSRILNLYAIRQRKRK